MFTYGKLEVSFSREIATQIDITATFNFDQKTVKSITGFNSVALSTCIVTLARSVFEIHLGSHYKPPAIVRSILQLVIVSLLIDFILHTAFSIITNRRL